MPLDLHLEKGELRRALKIPSGKKIPLGTLRAIKKAKVDTTIKNPMKTGIRKIDVTRSLKAEGVLALTMKTKWHHKKLGVKNKLKMKKR